MSEPSERPETMAWYEEYQTCSCSFIAKTRDELPGYCQKHGTDKKRRRRIPDQDYKLEDMGYAG